MDEKENKVQSFSDRKELIEKFLSLFHWSRLFAMDETNGKSPMINIDLEQIEILNSASKKYWIYFTYNWDYSDINIKNGIGRKEEFAKNIYCTGIDIDFDEKTWEGVIEPTIVVKTWKGYHCYFIYKEPLDATSWKKRRKAHIKKLVMLLKSDPKCTDLSRVQRVPFTKYWKDNKGDKEIKLISTNWPKYDFEELEAIVNSMGEPLEEMETDKKNFSLMSKWIRDLVDKINEDYYVWEVLEKISWWRFVERALCVYDNWEYTDWYRVNKQKNYVNSLSPHPERPHWWPYSVVAHYLRDTEKVLEWFKNNYWLQCDDIINDYKKKIIDIKSEPKTVIKNEDVVIIGDKRNKLKIDYTTCTTDFISETDKWVKNILFFNWIIEPIGYIHIDEWGLGKRKKMILKIINQKGWEFITLLKPVGSPAELRKALMDFWLIVAPDRVAVNILLHRIMDIDAHYWYTNSIWLQEIDWKRILIRSWWTYLLNDEKILVDIHDIKKEVIEEPQYINCKWNDIVENLWKIYSLSVIYPLLLLSIMHIYIYYWRMEGQQVPWCFIEWLMQSGKSLTKNFIIKDLLWYSFSMSASSTPFVYSRVLLHYMPINIEEFRNSSVKNLDEILWVVRQCFDWIAINKWLKDLSMVSMPANWQYIFDWQTKFSDWAAVSRNINIMTNPKLKWDLSAKAYFKNNILWNVLDIFPSLSDAKKFIEFRILVEADVISMFEKENYTEKARTIQIYSWLIALWRHLWLDEYESVLIESLKWQLTRDETDDILNTYMRCFNLYWLYKWHLEIVEWWAVLELNLEATKLSEAAKSDLQSMSKTINNYFNKDMKTDWIYIDFEYIFNKRSIWNRFRQVIRWAYIPAISEATELQMDTIRALRVFFEEHFKWDDFISDLNYNLKWYIKKKEKEIPF